MYNLFCLISSNLEMWSIVFSGNDIITQGKSWLCNVKALCPGNADSLSSICSSYFFRKNTKFPVEASLNWIIYSTIQAMAKCKNLVQWHFHMLQNDDLKIFFEYFFWKNIEYLNKTVFKVAPPSFQICIFKVGVAEWFTWDRAFMSLMLVSD